MFLVWAFCTTLPDTVCTYSPSGCLGGGTLCATALFLSWMPVQCHTNHSTARTGHSRRGVMLCCALFVADVVVACWVLRASCLELLTTCELGITQSASNDMM